MQDRFKFRLWDKTEKIMHFTDFVIAPTGYIAKLNELYNIEYDNEIDQEKEIKSENEFMIDNTDLDFEKDKILMQCTGLKDKNGKLIYEGDIVKVFHISSTGQGNLSKRHVAYDDDKGRYILCEQDFMSYITIDTDDILEVIGNIYENKELLEIKE